MGRRGKKGLLWPMGGQIRRRGHESGVCKLPPGRRSENLALLERV